MVVDGCEVPMEIDTGASRSIISESMFRSIRPKRKLVASKVKVSTYSKEPLPVVGALNVNVVYRGQTHELVLLVVKGSGPTLFGRNWMRVICLDWQHINMFQDGLGKFKGCKAQIMRATEAAPTPTNMTKLKGLLMY